MLIQCPECDRSISSTAKSCPQCGFALQDAIRQTNEPLFVGGTSLYPEKSANDAARSVGGDLQIFPEHLAFVPSKGLELVRKLGIGASLLAGGIGAAFTQAWASDRSWYGTLTQSDGTLRLDLGMVRSVSVSEESALFGFETVEWLTVSTNVGDLYFRDVSEKSIAEGLVGFITPGAKNRLAGKPIRSLINELLGRLSPQKEVPRLADRPATPKPSPSGRALCPHCFAANEKGSSFCRLCSKPLGA